MGRKKIVTGDEEHAPLMSSDGHADIRPYHSVGGGKAEFGGKGSEEVSDVMPSRCRTRACANYACELCCACARLVTQPTLPHAHARTQVLFQDGEKIDASLVTATVSSSTVNLVNTIIGAHRSTQLSIV
jgi:hypothetical protein